MTKVFGIGDTIGIEKIGYEDVNCKPSEINRAMIPTIQVRENKDSMLDINMITPKERVIENNYDYDVRKLNERYGFGNRNIISNDYEKLPKDPFMTCIDLNTARAGYGSLRGSVLQEQNIVYMEKKFKRDASEKQKEITKFYEDNNKISGNIRPRPETTFKTKDNQPIIPLNNQNLPQLLEMKGYGGVVKKYEDRGISLTMQRLMKSSLKDAMNKLLEEYGYKLKDEGNTAQLENKSNDIPLLTYGDEGDEKERKKESDESGKDEKDEVDEDSSLTVFKKKVKNNIRVIKNNSTISNYGSLKAVDRNKSKTDIINYFRKTYPELSEQLFNENNDLRKIE